MLNDNEYPIVDLNFRGNLLVMLCTLKSQEIVVHKPTEHRNYIPISIFLN